MGKQIGLFGGLYHRLDNFFYSHLRSIDESYASHMKHALAVAFGFMGTSFLIIVHAIIPGLFAANGSQFVMKLHVKFLSDPKRGKLYAEAVRSYIQSQNSEVYDNTIHINDSPGKTNSPVSANTHREKPS